MSQVIKVVTDSTADIPKEVINQYGITMVPLKVHFGQEVFLDAVTIEPGQFYEKLAASPVLPTTSQPSPIEFMEVYQEILAKEPEAIILSFHLSSALSGTYQSAVLARSMLEGEAGDITIVDTKMASFGIGLMAVTAARMAAQGSSKEEIIAETERLRGELRLYFLVDTLEYLQKGGRIGKAAALFGSILNIKPILTVNTEGTVAPVDKIRGQRKAMQRMMELLKADFGNDPVHLALAYAQHDTLAKQLEELAQAYLNVQEISHTTLGAVIGTHVGPGAAAIFMVRARG
ncbi:DegV family protein [Paenibacillaceae bacterium]|nr:DegV family protein [Paenibacillaceae bacterium]